MVRWKFFHIAGTGPCASWEVNPILLISRRSMNTVPWNHHNHVSDMETTSKRVPCYIEGISGTGSRRTACA